MYKNVNFSYSPKMETQNPQPVTDQYAPPETAVYATKPAAPANQVTPAIGDVVRLMSGGPAMTIVTATPAEISCVFHNSITGTYESVSFPSQLLIMLYQASAQNLDALRSALKGNL